MQYFEYLVEDALKIPSSRSKWPFKNMEIGQSVLVDGVSCHPKDCPGYNAAQQIARTRGMKFVGRASDNGKVRIWRVS